MLEIQLSLSKVKVNHTKCIQFNSKGEFKNLNPLNNEHYNKYAIMTNNFN